MQTHGTGRPSRENGRRRKIMDGESEARRATTTGKSFRIAQNHIPGSLFVLDQMRKLILRIIVYEIC